MYYKRAYVFKVQLNLRLGYVPALSWKLMYEFPNHVLSRCTPATTCNRRCTPWHQCSSRPPRWWCRLRNSRPWWPPRPSRSRAASTLKGLLCFNTRLPWIAVTACLWIRCISFCMRVHSSLPRCVNEHVAVESPRVRQGSPFSRPVLQKQDWAQGFLCVFTWEQKVKRRYFTCAWRAEYFREGRNRRKKSRVPTLGYRVWIDYADCVLWLIWLVLCPTVQCHATIESCVPQMHQSAIMNPSMFMI